MNIDLSMLKRIANVSQEIMYPSVPKRKEIPLRKLLPFRRLWEKAREEEERLSEIESTQAIGDDDWWLTSTDETLEALVSFVNESPRDPESPSALLDYSQQMFLNNTDDLESETWSWLDVGQETEEMPKVNAQNLLSHTLHLEELEDESEEDSEEDAYNTPPKSEVDDDDYTYTFPCKSRLLDHQTVQVGKKIIYINQDANAPMLPPPTSPIPTNTCKRKRDDVDDDGFEAAPPAKKLLLQNGTSLFF
ncbi:hypothetical protein EDC96DRAFT_526416 [Choanephora cucurbitarum]|nr:hypothetical protein EDC96DRAFT_526416 [Choanephora cucurbitarum]